MNPWICCQLGAREHYAIPRALHQTGQLASFITDAWVSPTSALNLLPNALMRSLRDRFHPDLATAPIQAVTSSLMQFELRQQLRKTSAWDSMIARNHWFQAQMIRLLEKKTFSRAEQPTFFTYSYAGLELLRYAKAQGWRTVLGQIDPGPVEEQIVVAEQRKYPALSPAWRTVPPEYWESWREECAIADHIIVNSNWSRQALEQAGIDGNKIRVVPLVYSPPVAVKRFERTYPDAFSVDRPLRVLFLGRVILRKGVAAVLEAAELVRDLPIEFQIVGSSEIVPPKTCSNIHWISSVPRSATANYYQQADVFLFPTLSDGFGLTQLEAQAWRLPVIASEQCGEVVQPNINGLVLPEVSKDAIADALRACVAQPSLLADFAQHTDFVEKFDLPHLQECLQQIQA